MLLAGSAECESSEETMLHVVTNEKHASTSFGVLIPLPLSSLMEDMQVLLLMIPLPLLYPYPHPPNTSLLTTKLSILSSNLELHEDAIEGIAKKAVDTLGTDGAITQVPGHSNDAKMVLRYSGKRPRLILPKRKCSGMFCDDDCAQYKYTPHTVAAAQYNGKLDSLIASYSTTKSTPNLTELAIASTYAKREGTKWEQNS